MSFREVIKYIHDNHGGKLMLGLIFSLLAFGFVIDGYIDAKNEAVEEQIISKGYECEKGAFGQYVSCSQPENIIKGEIGK